MKFHRLLLPCVAILTTALSVTSTSADQPKLQVQAQGQTQPINMTPEQLLEFVRLNPDRPISIDSNVHTLDQGALKKERSASGLGSGIETSGDNVDVNHAGTPPTTGLLGEDGGNATGGSDDSSAKAKTVPANEAMKSPLFWVGCLLLLAAGALFVVPIPPPFDKLKSLSKHLAIAGGGCLFAAFYPNLAKFIIAGVILWQFAPIIIAKWKELSDKHVLEGSLSGVLAGVEEIKDDATRKMVKGLIAVKTDEPHKDVIRKIKAAKGLPSERK